MRMTENPSSIANFSEAAGETARDMKARGFTKIIISKRTNDSDAVVVKVS